MTHLTLDFTNCLAESIGATHGLTDQEIDTLVAKFPKHHETIEELRASGESAFFDLPYQDLVTSTSWSSPQGQVAEYGHCRHCRRCHRPQTLLRVLLPEQWNLLDDKARKGCPARLYHRQC